MSTLLIASPEYCAKKHRAFRHAEPALRLVPPGAALAGRGFALILVHDSVDAEMRSDPQFEAWISHTVECRLLPGGVLVHL